MSTFAERLAARGEKLEAQEAAPLTFAERLAAREAAMAAADEEGEAMRAAAEPEYPAEQEFVGLGALGADPSGQAEPRWPMDAMRAAVEPHLGEQMRAPRARFGEQLKHKGPRSLLPPVSPSGEQVPVPDVEGLHPTQGSVYDMPPTEVVREYGGRDYMEEIPEEFKPEGVEGAFADKPAEPKKKDERTVMEKGGDQFTDALVDVAETVGGEVAKWASRVTVGNLGRAWGAISLPFKELADGASVINAVEEAEYFNTITDDMRKALADPYLVERMSDEQVRGMRQALADQSARRAEIAGYHSKIIENIGYMEDVIKDRVSHGAIELLYKGTWNALLDSRDITLGMGHLIFMDILGFGGESQEAAAYSDSWDASRWTTNAAEYSAIVLGDGVDSGEDISGGMIGAAMALAATTAPRFLHNVGAESANVPFAGERAAMTRGGLRETAIAFGASQYPDHSWRNRFGILPWDAFEAAPLTTSMFVHAPVVRAIARFRGKIVRGTALWKVSSDQFAYQYGAKAPEFLKWEEAAGNKVAAEYGRGAPEYAKWREATREQRRDLRTKPQEPAAVLQARINHGKKTPDYKVWEEAAINRRPPPKVREARRNYGKKTPEYKAWLRGDGYVPPELTRAKAAIERRKRALIEMVAPALDIGVELAHEGLGRPKRWAKEKVAGVPGAKPVMRAAGAAREATRTQSQRVSVALQQWWADALQQLDENSAIMANMTIRGTAELQAATLGLTRFMAESARKGQVWDDAWRGRGGVPPVTPGAPVSAIPQPPPLPPRLRDRSARPVVPLTRAEMSQRARQSVEGRRQLRSEGDRALFKEADSVAAAIDDMPFEVRGQKEAALDQQVRPLFDKKFGPKADGEYVAWLDSRKKYSLMDQLLKEEASGEVGMFGRADGVWAEFQKWFGNDAADILTPIYEAGELHKFLPERVVDAALGRKTGQRALMEPRSGETFEMTPYAPGADTRGIRPREPGPLPEAPAGFASGSKAVDAVKYPKRPLSEAPQKYPKGSVLDKAMELVRDHKKANVSYFQRKLKLPYKEAVEVFETLTKDGAIAPTGKTRVNEWAKRKGIKDAPEINEWDVVKPVGGDVLARAMELVREHKKANRHLIQEHLGLSFRETSAVLNRLLEDGAIVPTGKTRRNKRVKKEDVENAPWLYYSNSQTWDVATRKQPPRQPRTRGDLPPMPKPPARIDRSSEGGALAAWRNKAIGWAENAWHLKSKGVENAWRKENPSGGKLALKRHMEQERKKFVDDELRAQDLPREVEGGLLYDAIVDADDAWRRAEPEMMVDLPAMIGREPGWRDIQDVRLDFIEKRLGRRGMGFEVMFDEEGGLLGPLSEDSIAARRKAIEEAAPKKAPVYADPPGTRMAEPVAVGDAAPLPQPVENAPLNVPTPEVKANPATSYTPQRRRKHRAGVLEHEWDAFKRYSEERFGQPYDKLREVFGLGDKKRGEQLLANEWFKRNGQSRPQAAITAGIHNFSKAETLYWFNQMNMYRGAMHSTKKAEYLAYRDVLRNRGLKVTEDYRSLGLGVGDLAEFIEGKVEHPLLDDAMYRAAVEEAGGKLAVEAMSEAVAEQVNPGSPMWDTPARVSQASEQQIFAHLDRSLNEQYPVSRGVSASGEAGPLARRGLDADSVGSAINVVEETTGYRFTKTPLEEGFAGGDSAGLSRPGVQQELPIFERNHRFSPEVNQRIENVASSIGISPEYFKEAFSDTLNWRAYPYFLKSQVAQNRIKKTFNDRLNAFNKEQKNRGMPGIGMKQRGRMMSTLNGVVKSMSVGWGVRGFVKGKTKKGKEFSFDIMELARGVMESDKKFMGDVLADATLSAGFSMADSIRTAKIRDIAQKAYAEAPVTRGEIHNVMADAMHTGNRSAPALLRAPPDQAMRSLAQRMNEFDGAKKGWSMTDLSEAYRALERYEILPDAMMDFLHLDKAEGPAWAPRAFKKALDIELQTQDMIKANGIMDRALRTQKRGLVPLNFATTVRNTMSDWNLLALHEGRPQVFFDVIRSGKDLHRFQTGKMKRADNPHMYEVYEALERTGLVDATFLEANFGHGRFKGVMSIVGDMAQDQGRGYSSWRWQQFEAAIEKAGPEQLMKTFRASTNAFKQYKAVQAFGQIADAALKHKAGEVFHLEVRPNRWAAFEVQAGPGYSGGRYKHVDSGRVLTRQQWMDTVARTSKVTSDKLFFDYNDAGVWLKRLRAQPGVRWLMGSLFAMYYAKSATIPGVQRGLMRNVRNPNPAMRPGNHLVKYEFADRAARTDTRVSAMTAGARASMIVSEERDRIQSAAGWKRNRVPMAAFSLSDDPTSLGMYNFDNLDFHESTDTIVRAFGAGVLYTAESLGLMPDETGDLARIYALEEGDPLTEKQRRSFGLQGATKAERRMAEGLREIKMRELRGDGFRATDILEMAFLSGGPLLEGISKIQQGELSGRPVDTEQLLIDYGSTMMVGTFAKLGNVAFAMADPASKGTTLRYQLKDPDIVAREQPGFTTTFARWAIRTSLVRLTQRKDFDPESKKSKKRLASAVAGLRASFRTYEDAAKVHDSIALTEGRAAKAAKDPATRKKHVKAAKKARAKAAEQRALEAELAVLLAQEKARLTKADADLLGVVRGTKEQTRENPAKTK